jgi:predicted nuclease of predicted toxin-antitoxin system
MSSYSDMNRLVLPVMVVVIVRPAEALARWRRAVKADWASRSSPSRTSSCIFQWPLAFLHIALPSRQILGVPCVHQTNLEPAFFQNVVQGNPIYARRLQGHGLHSAALVYAEAGAHVGLSGEPDEHIWNYALEHDFVVVTTNARDFIRLLNVEVHPGLIVLRESDLTRDERWDRIQPIIDHILESSDDDFLLNKLVEILAAGEWEIREIPKP